MKCSLSLSLSLSLSYFGFRVLGFRAYFGCFIDANKFELKNLSHNLEFGDSRASH